MRFKLAIVLTIACWLGLIQAGSAAVLPEERVDIVFHSYDGGELQVNGPALLVRKNVGNSTSVSYKRYTDNITSASIDVELGGSPYDESRTEQTVGVSFLNGKTTLNLSYTDSTENDYEANTLSFDISQDFFGDLSTLTMGISQGNDDISERTSNFPSRVFEARSSIQRFNYRVGFSQILTKNSTVSLNWETITDEATSAPGATTTLNNPYRQYSYLINSTTRGFAKELYPRTRTSNAFAFRGSYFTPWKSALHYEARWFQDSWGIKSLNYGLTYRQPIWELLVDFRLSFYSQTQADFYRDLFDSPNQFTFMARDKEMSTFSNTSFGFGISYEFAKNGWGWIDKGSLNFTYDVISFEYDNFRDARQNSGTNAVDAGTEDLYAFDTDVMLFYISIWY